MKTLIALFFVVNMFGSSTPDYISTFYYNPSVTISFNNWKGGPLNVKMIDAKNNVVFNDKLITSKSDGITYNLSRLDAGKYKIILENSTKKVIETVILFDGKIVEKSEKIYYKPTVTINDDKIKVNFLNANGKAKVEIFEGNKTVFSEKFENVKPLNKQFDISNLTPGTYSVIVSDDEVSRVINFEK